MLKRLKRTVFFALLLLLALALAGCGGSGDTGGKEMDEAERFTLRATLLQVGERLEAEVIESDYAFGVYWVLTGEGTAYTDENGSAIARADLQPGDLIEITYGGQVMMSYPPQIVAQAVQRLGHGA